MSTDVMIGVIPNYNRKGLNHLVGACTLDLRRCHHPQNKYISGRNKTACMHLLLSKAEGTNTAIIMARYVMSCIM